MSLSEKLHQELAICCDKRNITVFDTFKTTSQQYYDLLKTHQPQSNIEEYIITLELDPRKKIYQYISQSHFENYFTNLYFTVGNDFLINDPIFDYVWNDRELLFKITDYMISLFEGGHTVTIDGKLLSKFYNQTLIHKFIDVLMSLKMVELDKITESKRRTYHNFWTNYFEPCVTKFTNYLISIKSRYDNTDKCGISLFPSLYEYCLLANISIPVKIGSQDANTIFDSYNKNKYVTTGTLEDWALYNIDRITHRVREIATILFKVNASSMVYTDVLKLFKDDPSQKFTSPEELENLYTKEINNVTQFYSDKIPEYEKAKLLVFNDKNKAGGYYYLNTFYLNTADFDHLRKYEIQPLTLHETIPGHHTQISTCMHSNQVSSLVMLFSGYFTGFIEGWGLFSESLHNNKDLFVEFGELEMEMLRTLRIVVDIRLNQKGMSANDMIAYMSNYLTCGNTTISSEVYRYITIPGQALCYRIGCEVLSHYFKADENVDRLSPDMIKKYNEVIHKGHIPLTWLMKST